MASVAHFTREKCRLWLSTRWRGLLFEREIERAERDLIDGRIFHGYEGNRIVSVSTTVQTTLPLGWYVALSELRYYTRFIVPTTVPSSSPLAYYLYIWTSVCVLHRVTKFIGFNYQVNLLFFPIVVTCLRSLLFPKNYSSHLHPYESLKNCLTLRDIKSRLDRIFVKLAVELSIFISSTQIHQHERIRIISPWTWSTRRAFSIRERESFKLAWGRSFLITRRRRAGWGGWVAARVPVCRRFVLPPLSRGRHCSRDSIGSQCRGPPRIVFFANLVRERERVAPSSSSCAS